MTLEARAWLPAGAMSDGLICMKLTEHAVAWARRWFGAAEGISVRMRQNAESAHAALGGASWESACQSLSLALDRTSQLRIAGAMLKLKQMKSNLSDPDMKLLRGLASSCIEDFLQRAAETFGVKSGIRRAADRFADEGDAPVVWYGVTFSTLGRSLDLCVRNDVAINSRKAMVTDAPRPMPKLGRREDAIARQSISVGARVGTGTLGLSDLSALACGDILVLDSGLKDRLDLTLNGVIQRGAECELVQDGPTLKLRVVKLEAGTSS